MKRFFSILLITALLLGLTTMVSSVALAEEYATVISDNGYGVRLREGPSKAYNVIAKYDVGTTVVVQQKGLEWSQLRVGDTVGWMMNAYLSFGTIGNVGEGGDVAGIGSATVISDNGLRVWLRTRPSGTRIRLYSPGTTVTVLEKGDPWSHISINGSIGYMMSRYLDFGSASAPVSRRVTAVSVNYAAPVAGDVLEAIVTPADATVAYSWKVDGVEQGTAATFNALTRYAGKKIQLTVTGIGACTGSATYTTEPVAATKRVDSVRLNKDEPYVGDTLSAITQPTSATVSYSWRVGGIEIGNEATYTVQESDLGKLIQLKVTGIDGFSGSAACSASAPVLSNKLVNSVKLTNTQPVPGDVLSFTVQPVGMTMDCVWKADGEVVGTTASYMVGQTDVGKVITLTVSGNGEFGGSVTVSTSKVTTARLVSVKIGNTAPLAGDWIYAVLEPKAATASYTWYADDEEIAVNRSTPDFVVPESAIGKKLTVKAIGTGAYTGTVNSAATGEVISSKQVTAVTLKNTTPVVGDTIGVKLTPAVLDDVQDQFSYVWTVGTTIKSNTSPVYTVEEEDVGKTIRVRVVGANGYTGDVYSAYTNPVIGESRLTGVTIWNNATDANATQHAPEVGDTLRALVGPAQAQDKGDVHYVWRTNNEGVVLEGDGAAYETYTVLERDRGMQISVTVSGIGKYVGDGKTTYTAAAARVATLEPLTVALNVPAPEAGKKPVYSVTGPTAADGRTILWRASLEWLDTEYNSGKLDEFGNFLPNYTYMVRATIAPANGYTMNPNVGATATVNGSTAEMSATPYITPLVLPANSR